MPHPHMLSAPSITDALHADIPLAPLLRGKRKTHAQHVRVAILLMQGVPMESALRQSGWSTKSARRARWTLSKYVLRELERLHVDITDWESPLTGCIRWDCTQCSCTNMTRFLRYRSMNVRCAQCGAKFHMSMTLGEWKDAPQPVRDVDTMMRHALQA